MMSITAIKFSSVWCAINFWFFLQYSVKVKVNRENFVFSFQMRSFIALFIVLTIILLLGGNFKISGLVGAIAVHGIFSLSVLEIWSLTQGSYSFNILLALSKRSVFLKDLINQFALVGVDKKASRIKNLVKFGFVIPVKTPSLTKKGLIIAKVILRIRKFAGFRNAG
jgi:hypothetical protein